jgi:hypothetical protein
MRHLLNLSRLREEEEKEEENVFYPSRRIDWSKIAEKQ